MCNFGQILEIIKIWVFVGVPLQNMVLVSWAQLFKEEVLRVVVNSHIVKLIGVLEGIIEASNSTIVDGHRQLDFTGWLACSSGSIPKQDWPIGQKGVIKVIIEITGSILEQRCDKVGAIFHSWDVDWIFSVELDNCLTSCDKPSFE